MDTASHQKVTIDPAAFVSRCFPRRITVPARLRDGPLEILSSNRWISTRLAHVLQRRGVRVLGDLDGRQVGDFAWQRNCGLKTLQELDSLVFAVANQSSSHNRWTTSKREAGEAAFVVPKSICRLKFDQLPTTKRLANVVRSNGLRTLGNLHGHTPFELLQYKACGWRTVAEIQQLFDRAIFGEFDVAGIRKSTAVAELLTLLEQGMAKLSRRENQVLRARITGLTFAEIGRRLGFTRARAHQIVAKALDALSKTWGPRVPRLFKILKQRCLSLPNSSRLTPALLDRCICEASTSSRLSRKEQVRLIGALGENIRQRRIGNRRAASQRSS